jgi:hypothetical protein
LGQAGWTVPGPWTRCTPTAPHRPRGDAPSSTAHGSRRSDLPQPRTGRGGRDRIGASAAKYNRASAARRTSL